MKTYKFSPEGFRQAIIKTVPGIIIIIVLVLLGGGYISFRGQLSASTYGGVIPILLVLVGIGLYKGIRKGIEREREGWLTYQLVFDNDVITKKQAYLPDVEIRRDQVVSIQEKSSKGMVIKTKNKYKFIFIPASLEEYDEVKKCLSDWQEFESLPRQASQIFLLVLACLGTAMALVITLVSENRLIVLPMGVLFCICMVWCIIKIRHNPYVDVRIKRNCWLILFLMILVVAKLVSLFK
ncbi:MAG: hypothetical protein H6Q73_2745 [Firmicutes bacterium]|nr:hypothetical protein [Bacillota bacterium]